MIRDKALTKSILLFIEEHAQKHGITSDMTKTAVVDDLNQEDDFDYHFNILVDKGYLSCYSSPASAEGYLSVTWAGHELLENLLTQSA